MLKTDTANKIDSLQMLRAVAVALVMSIHLTNFLDLTEVKYTSPLTNFFQLKSWGAIGVDLFFAISGFIMILVTPAYVERGGWRKFLAKRAIRILPVYYLVSVAVFFINSRHDVFTDESILKTLLFLPFFDKDIVSTPIVYVGWSLSYEIYFYLLLSLFLNFKRNLRTSLLVVLVVLSLTGYLFNPSHVLLRFFTNPLLLEFAFGILVGLLYKSIYLRTYFNSKSAAVVLIISGAVLMLTSIFTGSKDINMHEIVENDNYKALFRVVIWGVPSAMLLLGVVLLERVADFTTPALMILLGDASFSAYLIHIKVYQWYSKLFSLTGFNGTVFIMSAFVVCFAASVVFYKLVERPITMAFSKLLTKKNRFVVAPHT